MEPNAQSKQDDSHEFFGGEMKPFIQKYTTDNGEEIIGVTAKHANEKKHRPSFWRRFLGLFTL